MTAAIHVDENAPVADDEVLYRRIPVSQQWYDPAVDPKPLFQAFRPRTDDVTGLSVVRGQPYNTAEEAARGPSKRGYYVAVLRVRDLRAHGIDVAPRPVAGIRGHAEITNLTAANRDVTRPSTSWSCWRSSCAYASKDRFTYIPSKDTSEWVAAHSR